MFKSVINQWINRKKMLFYINVYQIIKLVGSAPLCKSDIQESLKMCKPYLIFDMILLNIFSFEELLCKPVRSWSTKLISAPMKFKF